MWRTRKEPNELRLDKLPVDAWVLGVLCIGLGILAWLTHGAAPDKGIELIPFGLLLFAVWGNSFVVRCDRATGTLALENRSLHLLTWRRRAFTLAQVVGVEVVDLDPSDDFEKRYGVDLQIRGEPPVRLGEYESGSLAECEAVAKQLVEFFARRPGHSDHPGPHTTD